MALGKSPPYNISPRKKCRLRHCPQKKPRKKFRLRHCRQKKRILRGVWKMAVISVLRCAMQPFRPSPGFASK